MESTESPRLARPDPRGIAPNIDMLARVVSESNMSTLDFACAMVLVAPGLPPKYCSELQARLNYLTRTR